MLNPPPVAPRLRRMHVANSKLLALVLLGSTLSYTPSPAQSEASAGESGCKFKAHVYTCDGAVFQTALTSAKTVRVEAQNADGVARGQLRDLVTHKLGKAVSSDGTPADLIFLLIPTGVEGVNISPGEVDLGTLRIYSPAPDGTRGRLVWAENFSGQQDLPWPIVVRGLISQFQTHFHIK